MAAKFKLAASRPWLLFAGDNYYPSGGVSDFVGSFRAMRQAVEALQKVAASVSGSWAQVVCTETGARHDFQNEDCPWDVRYASGAWVEVEPRDRFRPCDEAEDGA